MKLGHTQKAVFSAAAVLALGASLALAQDPTKPTSTKRIPISKEAPGEVVTRSKTDTVTVYKTDTLRLTNTLPGRVDTVRTTNTMTRYDTVTVAPLMKPMGLPGGLYFGLAGGVSAPNGSIYNPNNAGPSVQAQLGWHGAKNLLGVRLDVNYANPGQDAAYAAFQKHDPSIVNVNGDLKLNLPLFNHMFGISPRFNLYGIGGGSYINYKNLPIRITAAGGIPPANVLAGQDAWESHWGWNAGGGASIGWRRVEVFTEVRVIAWTTDVSPQARQMPFMLGMNLY